MSLGSLNIKSVAVEFDAPGARTLSERAIKVCELAEDQGESSSSPVEIFDLCLNESGIDGVLAKDWDFDLENGSVKVTLEDMLGINPFRHAFLLALNSFRERIEELEKTYMADELDFKTNADW